MDVGKGLRVLLDEAHSALAGGEAADAERRAKAVSALIRAERDVADFIAAEAADTETDEDVQRAELLGRITRLVQADHAGAPDEVLERIASGVAAP
ncbi:MAG TPA: hypothetical protein VEF55_13070 [Candidatus Binatia bacterium]|nr:hypothetical protein [Candidatus Binatia bacterium]